MPELPETADRAAVRIPDHVVNEEEAPDHGAGEQRNLLAMLQAERAQADRIMTGLRAELDENTGVLAALRRQRDTAEADLARLRGELEQARATAPAPDAGADALRSVADFYEDVLQQSLDPESDPRYCTAVRDVVMGLRRRAADAPGGQAESDARPAETEWVVETRRHDGEWRRWTPPRATRDEARQDYARAVANDAKHPFRLVRVTTTYTVEQPGPVSEDGAQQ